MHTFLYLGSLECTGTGEHTPVSWVTECAGTGCAHSCILLIILNHHVSLISGIPNNDGQKRGWSADEMTCFGVSTERDYATIWPHVGV